jgi:O-phosphoseryl-tRNA(Sec) kinase
VIGTDEVRYLFPSQLETFDPNLEPFIKNLTQSIIKTCLKENYLVINDDMNYYKSMRHELKQIAEELKSHFILIHVQISLDTALKWNKKRGLPIPQDVISKVNERFDKPGDYQWDSPLLTIQVDEDPPELAVKKIIPKLIPIITALYQPSMELSPSEPGIIEKLDKITRDIIADFAKKNKNPKLLKKISKFRIDYLKNFPINERSLEIIEKEFSLKLKDFISHIKQAK